MKSLSAKHFEDSNTCHLQLEETALIYFPSITACDAARGKSARGELKDREFTWKLMILEGLVCSK